MADPTVVPKATLMADSSVDCSDSQSADSSAIQMADSSAIQMADPSVIQMADPTADPTVTLSAAQMAVQTESMSAGSWDEQRAVTKACL
jgi:hypothetical protein